MKNSLIKNIGILGASSFAIRSMIPAIKSLPELFNLIGIATKNVHKIKNLDSNIKIYEDYDQLIEQTNIDIIYIPLPNSLHFEYAKKCLLNNKHVIIEKSIACELEHVIELVNLANINKLTLIENFCFLHHAQFSVLKELLINEYIGDLKYIRTNFSFPPFQDKNNIRYDHHLGGGALLDAGVYPIKIINELIGADLIIENANMIFYEFKNIDIQGYGTLRNNKKDIFAQFFYGFNSYYQCNIELLGTKGRIATNRIFTAPVNYTVTILLEKNGITEILEVPPDDHFVNSLKYFNHLINNDIYRLTEMNSITSHARITNSFKIISKKTVIN